MTHVTDLGIAFGYHAHGTFTESFSTRDGKKADGMLSYIGKSPEFLNVFFMKKNLTPYSVCDIIRPTYMAEKTAVCMRTRMETNMKSRDNFL